MGSLVSLYFNSDFGFIITPSVKLKSPPLWHEMDEVIKLESNVSDKELGEAVAKAIELSKNATQTKKEEFEGKESWRVSGIKSYRGFCKKFECVDISEIDDVITINKLYKDNQGGYTYPKDEEGITMEKGDNVEKLGFTINNIFRGIVEYEFSEEASFKTINETKVSFTRPCDDFIDRGDGGSDLYQVYAHQDYDQNYIAFEMDMGDVKFVVDEVKTKWQQRYLNSADFPMKNWFKGLLTRNYSSCSIDFVEIGNKMICKYRTNKMETTVVTFKDSDGVLEVICEIDILNTPIQIQQLIKEEFEKLVSSISLSEI